MSVSESGAQAGQGFNHKVWGSGQKPGHGPGSVSARVMSRGRQGSHRQGQKCKTRYQSMRGAHIQIVQGWGQAKWAQVWRLQGLHEGA